MPGNVVHAFEPASEPASRFARFRKELLSPEISFAMEAHDGLSAKIVEEAGFKVIWGSGLTISAALGVRDRNEASWTQVLEVLEFMADSTSVPILVDGDTGYGDFNNVRRLVRKLCQRGVAAVCIEDKLFPKTNSFIGEHQPLADLDEFCGKIKAGKDSQTDDDFCLIARIEALIAGYGIDEALHRAEAYHAAGADGILIHSKKNTADEILRFKREWGDRCPVLIVPTMYYATPTESFREAGISMVIWANHNLRAAIRAMRDTSRQIFEEQSLTGVEGSVASVKGIFELTGAGELAEAEKRYLAPSRGETRAILLAASRGSKLAGLTEDRPKCMLDIRGQPLLRRLVSTLNEGGIRDITVVRGYAKQAIDLPAIETIDNDAYETTDEAASLARAADRLEGDCLVCYGDVLFRSYILEGLLAAEGDIVLAVDSLWRDRVGQSPDRTADLVACSRPFTGDYLEEDPVRLVFAGDGLRPDEVAHEIHGEWIGLAKLSAAGSRRVRAELAAMERDGSLEGAGLPALFQRLIDAGEDVRVVYSAGHWLDVNDAFDLAKARNFL